MEKAYSEGVVVIFVDPHGIRRPALVTQWHCGNDREAHISAQQRSVEVLAAQDPPIHTAVIEACCNLVWVSGDVKRKDTYGQQLIRESSVVHRASQPAHGNYWCWPDEMDG